MDSKEFSLTVGGSYMVAFDKDNTTSGIFKGYSSIGSDIAIVIEPENGGLRFIPVQQIMYIDQLSLPKSEDEPKKVDIYYR